MKKMIKKWFLKIKLKHEEHKENSFIAKLSKERMNSLDQIDYSKIREIYQSVYTGVLLEDAEKRYSDTSALLEYCKCKNKSQIKIIYQDNWYMALAYHYRYTEIFDYACLNGKINNAHNIIDQRNLLLKTQTVPYFAYLREVTSYPLIKMMEKRNKLKILNETEINYAGEKLFAVSFLFM